MFQNLDLRFPFTTPQLGLHK